jgi:RNA polymerase sigma-70 factor (ECF subfamily)
MVESPLHDQVEKAYEQARNDVYYYLLTLGLNPPEAQETTQDVFLRLYVTLSNGEVIQNVRGWIFRVAHNLGLNVRTRKRESLAIDDIQLASSANPERNAILNQRDRRLREALLELSPQQRQCLHLRAEGLRYHEIADVLGVTTSTVNEFIRRGIAKLKKKVAHE